MFTKISYRVIKKTKTVEKYYRNSVNRGTIADVCTHVLYMLDITLVGDDIIMLLS